MITHPTFNNIVAISGTRSGTTEAAAASEVVIAPDAGIKGRLGVYISNTGGQSLWVELYTGTATATLSATTATLIIPSGQPSQFIPAGAALGISVASPAAGTTTFTVTEVIQ